MKAKAKAKATATANDTAALLHLLYLVTLVAGGMALIALTPSRDLGAIGYAGGALLAFTGGGLLVGRLRGLGEVAFACPSCHHEQTREREALEGARPIPCASCGSYLRRRAAEIEAVDPEEVVAVPTFEAPLPPGSLAWPEGCALCGSTPCDREEVEGVTDQGRGPIHHVIRVPVCVHHRGEQAVELGRGEVGSGGFALRFRSYAVARRFRELNRPAATATAELELERV